MTALIITAALRDYLTRNDLASIKTALTDQHTADIANFAGDLEASDIAQVLRLLPERRQAEVFGCFPPAARAEIAGALTCKELAQLVTAMSHDQRADLFNHLSPAEQQALLLGGNLAVGGPDLDLRASSFVQMFKVRGFWLVMLTVFGVITSTFVAAQEEMLSQIIVLAAFIAPIVDMGGNAGSQSATLVIRAMALGDLKLRWRDVWFVIRREIPVALMLGLVIALLEAVLAFFSKGVGGDLLLVVGLSMAACTVLGGVIGALLPFAARRIGTDPATLSSPMITSVMDLLGVFIYFSLAYAFLGHLAAG